MIIIAPPNAYLALVDGDGNYLRNWTTHSDPIVQYLFHHHQARLLICQQSPDDQDDCSIIATIESQLTIDRIGRLAGPRMRAGMELINVLDVLLRKPLNHGDAHGDAAHAKRLAYLSLDLAAFKHLSVDDTNLLILTAYLHDFELEHRESADRHGLQGFSYYLNGATTLNANVLHATLKAILARTGHIWSKAATNRLIAVLTAAPAIGQARRLQTWAADIRTLDALNWRKSVQLFQLHHQDEMRLLYASHQEYQLISAENQKERLL